MGLSHPCKLDFKVFEVLVKYNRVIDRNYLRFSFDKLSVRLALGGCSRLLELLVKEKLIFVLDM